MYVSVWCVPRGALPAWPLPRGVRPLMLRRRCVLLTIWADYQRGGVLEYHELLVALAVRHRWRIAATAVSVWVDNQRSKAGGRALWGIPKECARLVFRHDQEGGFRAELTADADTHAGPGTNRSPGTNGSPGRAPGVRVRGSFRDAVRLPVRLTLRTRLVQRAGTDTRHVPLRLTGTVSWGRGRILVAAPAARPAAALNGRRPLLSVAVRDFRFTVGRDDGKDGHGGGDRSRSASARGERRGR
ncbi:acetoacetate decarboxylase family protein [Streptomyces sp. MST-110588]|uniref:acetoacetate decarboxylase family protein n=1 Tax=Streptomyces sp. MST-110588 TaxID=2833628 RepID=UPI001F5DD583|nr:acetoacetate decarboxylase family protein [Streptomyces sp. MST-110588]UNO43499.1 acetoacetate decarboxylase family protein [Streptomyces sp. MST-110588]